MSQAIVAGHLCLDIAPKFEIDRGPDLNEYLIPGRLTDIGPATLCTGGTVSNTGINLHKLGITTQLMGKIGDDLLGKAILEVIHEHDPNLAQGMTVVPGESTSYTLVIDPPGVDRAFMHYPGTNDTFGVDDIRYDLLNDTRLFHFGYPPLMKRMYAREGHELAEIFRRAKERGVTTSLDLAMPDKDGPSGQPNWQTILTNTLPHVDYFMPSVEELLFMLRRERFDELTGSVGAAALLEALAVDEVVDLAERALDLGAKVTLLKAGARGLYLRTIPALSNLGRGAPDDLAAWSDRQLWAPCFLPRAVVSTAGTGDASIAGFLSAVLRGAGPSLALSAAAAAGACCVEVPGTLGGVPSWAEMLDRVEAGWERLPLELPGFGKLDSGVWLGAADREKMS